MTSFSDLEHSRRRQLLKLLGATVVGSGLSACGGGSTAAGDSSVASATAAAAVPATSVASTTTTMATTTAATATAATAAVAKSAKRGIAYDLSAAADLAVLSPGVSWWYNWGTQPNSGVPSNYLTAYGMDYYPMLWNGTFDATAVVAYLKAHTEVAYLLLMNEPNLVDQSNLTPQQAAQLWPSYEAIATQTGVKLMGPAITWGTMSGYNDPVLWLDAFYAAYQGANAGRDPQIDYLAFHWYDYGLAGQLDALTKYGKPFWVTEMANWHSQTDGAQIDTLAKQEAQMTAMVALCEGRSDVFRYAWFTGRMDADPHFTSLLGASGELTALGQLYLSLPFASS